MSFFSFKIRPIFRTLGVIATCFWLSLITAYVADRLSEPTPQADIHQPTVVVTTVPEVKEVTPPLTAEQIAERLNYGLYGSPPYRSRLRTLMLFGDGALLNDFRTDFMADFKGHFGSRLNTQEKAEPNSELIVAAVLDALGDILFKDDSPPKITFADLPGNLDNLPDRAYALYLRSLEADRAQGIALMDELLALPAKERLPLNAIAKYRRARLRMSHENWSDMSDADVKTSLRLIREDLASVAQHAREGSLDPAEISDNAAYWIAHTRSMILPSERLIRLGEADYAAAVTTYLRMPPRGQANAVNSCLWLARKLCEEGHLEVAVADADLRLLITLFLCAGGGNTSESMLTGDLVEQRRNEWLDALAKAKIDPAFAPGYIALLQYDCGRWQDCRRSAELMPPVEPLRKLLLARCQLRLDGDMSAARRLLDPRPNSAAAINPSSKAAAPVTTQFNMTTLISLQEDKELRDRVQGELGLHALANNELDVALTCFEAGGYGVEALYVAECLLTLEELKQHVVTRRKDGQKPIKMESHWLEPFDDLEQELTSRLMRTGRLEEALEFVAPSIRSQATHYVLLRRGAERTDLGDRSRADSYWRCALAIRELGESILHAPYGQSWTSSGGWHVGYGYFPRLRLGKPLDDQPLPTMKLVAAGPEELRRLSEWQASHIDQPDLSERDARYASFRHALQAVRLLPDNDPAGGEILQYAGNLLKYRDPKAAQPAYVLLVTRFKETPYGKHALKARWFSSERPSPPSDIISK
jgi:hypothetical protein